MGVFKSSYFLALVWLLHSVWDFVPRDLPILLKDLPNACILFDLPIGLYLLWGSRQKHWQPFDTSTQTELWYQFQSFRSHIPILKTLYTLLLLVVVSTGLLSLAQKPNLVWLALLVSILLILALRWLGARTELIAWAVFTGWLGMTYAHLGGTVDTMVFILYIMLSALGVFYSSYILALAWLVFIPWNFFPTICQKAMLKYP